MHPVVFLGLSWLALAAATSLADEASPTSPDSVDFFERKIRPVLVERCFKCHSSTAKKVEGGVIERQSPSRYIYRTQRHHPTNHTLLAERSETVFKSAEAAARHYLKWDLHLPGDLDGWKVIA